MRVLVTFAVEAEFGPWRSSHRFRRCRLAREGSAVASHTGEPWESVLSDTRRAEQLPLYESAFDGIDATVLLTGVGPQISRRNITETFIQRAVQRPSFDLCVSAGFAGALRPGLSIGEILTARHLCSDAREGEGFALPKLTLEPDLVRLASQCGATVIEQFLTSDHIVRSAAEKNSLSAEAEAVEMESYSVLSEAAAWGVRGIAVRTVSDDTSEDLPIDFRRTIDAQGRISYARVAGEVARHPGALLGLARFGRNSRLAAHKIAQFLDRYLPLLASKFTPGLDCGSAVAAQ